LLTQKQKMTGGEDDVQQQQGVTYYNNVPIKILKNQK
jgi:hypothetical protein